MAPTQSSVNKLAIYCANCPMRISTATPKTRESFPPRRATQSHGTMDWPLEAIVTHSPQHSTAFMVVICARLRLMTDRVRDRLGLGCPGSNETRRLVNHLLASGVCCGTLFKEATRKVFSTAMVLSAQ